MDLLHFVNGSLRSTQATVLFQFASLVVQWKPHLLSTSISQKTNLMQSITLQQEASTFAKRKLKQPRTVLQGHTTKHTFEVQEERLTKDYIYSINVHLSICVSL